MTELLEKNTIRSRRRQAILKAAAEEFCQNGFEHARMDAIAARAGIGKSTIYEYFPSKSALLRAVGEQMTERTMREIETVLHSDLCFRNKMIGYLRFLNSMIARMGEKLLHLFRENNSQELLHELSKQYSIFVQQLLTKQIEKAQVSGELDPNLDAATAAALLGSIPCTLFHHHNIAIESVVDLLLQGMEKKHETI